MSKIKNAYWAVYRWVKWDLPYIHYDLLYGIKNLVKWFRLIWSDRNYDYSFMLDILKFKLEGMASLHREHGNFHRESRIKICIKLIDRIQSDFYWMPHYEQIKTDISIATDLVDACRSKHNKAVKLLFKIMEQEMETWWI